MFGTLTVSLLIALLTSLPSHTCTAAKLIFLNFIMIMSFPCSESFNYPQGPESSKSVSSPMRSPQSAQTMLRCAATKVGILQD